MPKITLTKFDYNNRLETKIMALNGYRTQLGRNRSKLEQFLDLQERRSSSRRKNGASVNDKIKFYFEKVEFWQAKVDDAQHQYTAFMERFEHDGVPLTESQINSRFGIALNEGGSMNDTNFPSNTVKNEPTDEIKEEATDEPMEEDIKQEVIMTNVIKSEPQNY